jgi:hypothetical protein|tara:strand:+ start:501 stop:707 length:207 start_codon:yes stop_codon:yes gene_type:complete
MADVTDHPQKNISSINNGSIVVGAPKAAGTDAVGANFTIDAVQNDADTLGNIENKLKTRFDNVNYYTS